MPDYSKGKIYKIVCNDTGLTYIGSTTTELNRRLSHHKNDLNCSSKEIIQNNNYHIELIEDVNATCKLELLKRERYWIENIDCVNKIIPTRTKDELNMYKKQWYENDKERINKYKKQWYQQHKERIKEQYYQQNREQILERNRLRYQQKKLQHSLSSSSS